MEPSGTIGLCATIAVHMVFNSCVAMFVLCLFLRTSLHLFLCGFILLSSDYFLPPCISIINNISTNRLWYTREIVLFTWKPALRFSPLLQVWWRVERALLSQRIVDHSFLTSYNFGLSMKKKILSLNSSAINATFDDMSLCFPTSRLFCQSNLLQRSLRGYLCTLVTCGARKETQKSKARKNEIKQNKTKDAK